MNTWEDYMFAGPRAPLTHIQQGQRTDQAIAQRGDVSQLVLPDGSQTGIPGLNPMMQDDLGRHGTQDMATRQQLIELMRPLQEEILYGSGNALDREPTVNALRELAQRPAYAPYANEMIYPWMKWAGAGGF